MKALRNILLLSALTCLSTRLDGQVNSGSDGSDGALAPTTNVVIDMADHTTGIYQYTSVNIPSGVTIAFKPNANNSPVVWLVQGDCTIVGIVNVDGMNYTFGTGGAGGPGGFAGGNSIDLIGYPGQGPGGGSSSRAGSYGTGIAPYGSKFLLPLIGGSGGGGGGYNGGGGGGGGAILIAASGNILVSGKISAKGAPGLVNYGGAGSGGAIRLLATHVTCTGEVIAIGGNNFGGDGGAGRVRIDAFNTPITGSITGVLSQGFQPIIIPAFGQGIQLSIASIGGVAVPATPLGVVANPDVILAAQQSNPIPVVVNCSNIPLGTPITVTAHPASGADVTATGTNSSGTQLASSATIAVNMPRGGGIVYATAVTGIGGGASTGSGANSKVPSIAQTGWTADGKMFVAMEVTAAAGGRQRFAYITESGKRYSFPEN